MEAAQALAEKVALGHELAEQHRLQCKAKVAELEKMTALEVKLAKARETRHGVRDAAPWVRSATGGRVLGRGPGTMDAGGSPHRLPAVLKTNFKALGRWGECSGSGSWWPSWRRGRTPRARSPWTTRTVDVAAASMSAILSAADSAGGDE